MRILEPTDTALDGRLCTWLANNGEPPEGPPTATCAALAMLGGGPDPHWEPAHCAVQAPDEDIVPCRVRRCETGTDV